MFPRKLMEMLEGEDPAVIGWNAEGSSFTIHDMDRFTETTLLHYFRHQVCHSL